MKNCRRAVLVYDIKAIEITLTWIFRFLDLNLIAWTIFIIRIAPKFVIMDWAIPEGKVTICPPIPSETT